MKKILTIASIITCLFFAQNGNAQCTAPTNLQSNYANNVTTFSWDAVPGALSYWFDIDWAGAPWGSNLMEVTNNSFSFTGLMQGGNFQWHVRANCATDSSAYSQVFYTTPCLAPITLSTTNISTNSAKLNWANTANINTNNTGFSVSYKLASSNTWIQLTPIYNNITAVFYNLTGLAAGTAYDWRVRRACASMNSNYEYGSFVTLSCLANGINTNEWIDRFSIGSINRISTAETGGYVNTNLSTNLTIGTNNAGVISAGFAGNTYNQKFSVFIDFNNNGSFADAGEKVVNNASINNANNINFNINIPSNAVAGSRKMRVIMRRGSGSITSCITGFNGEAEDYIVNIIPSTLRQAAPIVEEDIMTAELKFTVSPNPTNGILQISSPVTFDAQKYVVRNLSGSIIAQGSFDDTKFATINISNQKAGLYLVSIINSNGVMQHAKVLLQ